MLRNGSLLKQTSPNRPAVWVGRDSHWEQYYTWRPSTMKIAIANPHTNFMPHISGISDACKRQGRCGLILQSNDFLHPRQA